MKKLIEELEVLKRVSRPVLSEWGEGYTSGVMDALRIVKSYDPWIPISELPPMDIRSGVNSMFSVIVIVKTELGGYAAGYYFPSNNLWYDTSDELIAGVTHWTYLPEAKP